jgi:large subunit ribosomal protein L10
LERAKKEELVNSLHAIFGGENNLLVVTRPAGLTVAEVSDLRRQMREAGCGFTVTKNRLAKLALKGTKFEPVSDLFKGPTAVAYSRDPVAAARIAVKYADANQKLSVIGGALEAKVLKSEEVTSLAKLPSLDELRAKIVGMIATPATRIAGVLQAPAGQLARVLSAHAKAGGESKAA